jgi:hypothetical protein
MINRPIRAFYLGRVLVGIIREVANEHVHEFYGLSGEGRVLPKIEFWDRIKIVRASEHFVVTKGWIYKTWH